MSDNQICMLQLASQIAYDYDDNNVNIETLGFFTSKEKLGKAVEKEFPEETIVFNNPDNHFIKTYQSYVSNFYSIDEIAWLSERFANENYDGSFIRRFKNVCLIITLIPLDQMI